MPAFVKGHTELKKIRMEGHTDNVGGVAFNQRLSEGRARSVRAWLASHGIEAERSTSKGLGQSPPVGTDDTEEGRRDNRRVEFHIEHDTPTLGGSGRGGFATCASRLRGRVGALDFGQLPPRRTPASVRQRSSSWRVTIDLATCSAMLAMVSSTARYAQLETYLRELPAGIGSHPEAEIKASVYRGAIEDRPLTGALEHLPSELADLVTSPRLVSTWVPTTHVQCLYLAIADHYRMTESVFREWSYQMQKRLYSGALYRSLLSLASPSLLLQGAKLRWRAVHRGTDLDIFPEGDQGALIHLRYPDGLYARMNLIGFESGFRTTAEIANGRTVQVDLKSATRREARFSARWR